MKISSRNFGRDRRYPITNKFREAIAAVPATAPTPAGPSVALPRADGGEWAEERARAG